MKSQDTGVASATPQQPTELQQYLAVEANHRLHLGALYRDMADHNRASADDLQAFLNGPEGHTISELRAVLAVEVERINLAAHQWDHRADEAEKFALANLPRGTSASN